MAAPLRRSVSLTHLSVLISLLLLFLCSLVAPCWGGERRRGVDHRRVYFSEFRLGEHRGWILLGGR
jgi:hypothetical protein